MDSRKESNGTGKFTDLPPGILIRGTVISSAAKALPKKDGSGLVVRIQIEIATQPGVVIQEEWLDPKETAGVVLEGSEVKTFPAPAAFSEVLLRAGRFRVYNGQFYVSNAELVA